MFSATLLVFCVFGFLNAVDVLAVGISLKPRSPRPRSNIPILSPRRSDKNATVIPSGPSKLVYSTSLVANADGTYTNTFSAKGGATYQDCTDILSKSSGSSTTPGFCDVFLVYDPISGKSYRGDCITDFSKAVDKCTKFVDKNAGSGQTYTVSFAFTGRITAAASSAIPKSTSTTTTATATPTVKTIKIPARNSNQLYWIGVKDRAEF
ncbi:hypothetical protein HDU97_000363 [Phlyctochytrium planicorne]|nr:hypothetical protein HDU97_000363 [Phlyctochytrium planicorne]